MKTAELTGAALDWAVAQCEGFDNGDWLPDYSTDWAAGGSIIEREGICLHLNSEGLWEAWLYEFGTDGEEMGRNEAEVPLIAAMRCYVASKLGDDVELPEELLSCAHD